jgi:ABC-type glycerol-3-phosphate transport system substrate-binding protein
MKKRPFLFSICIAFCLASLFAGGNSQSAQPSQGGTVSSSSGPVKLSVAIAEDLRIQDYETNHMTGILERDGNVDLSFVLFPSTDYVNKLNLMVMAGGAELPDIIIASPGDAMVYQWAKEGAINVEENEAIRDIQASLTNYVLEMTSAFLAGNRDIDSSWNPYVTELNNIGLAKFLSVNQVVYDRMYRK